MTNVFIGKILLSLVGGLCLGYLVGTAIGLNYLSPNCRVTGTFIEPDGVHNWQLHNAPVPHPRSP